MTIARTYNLTGGASAPPLIMKEQMQLEFDTPDFEQLPSSNVKKRTRGMTVKRMIAHLEKQDPDARVVVHSRDEKGYLDVKPPVSVLLIWNTWAGGAQHCKPWVCPVEYDRETDVSRALLIDF